MLIILVACTAMPPDAQQLTTDEPTTPGDSHSWYPDNDADGFGAMTGVVRTPTRPDGYLTSHTDCDDSNPNVFPGAVEVCNDRDDDCDGSTDNDATDALVWYPDLDGDSYGNPDQFKTECTAPEHGVANNQDCDDDNADVHPAAPELCNGRDDDCNTLIDDAVTDVTIWYRDADDDGFGDPATWSETCDAPAGFIEDASDCDDGDDTVFPGAPELCDLALNDCDLATSWKWDHEDGLATFYSLSGAPSDMVLALAITGTSPVSVPAGTVQFCRGVFEGSLSMTGADDWTLVGLHGSEHTILSAMDGEAAVKVVGAGATLVVEGLSLTNGSDSGLHAEGADLTLTDVSVYDNTAVLGGGIYAVSGSETKFQSVVITANEADSSGGGLYLRDADVDAQDLELLDNVAGNKGGGMYLASPGSPVYDFEELTVQGNVATTQSGGGLYGSGQVSVIDAWFSDNVSGSAGTLSLTGGSLAMLDVTMTDNRSDYAGAAIDAGGSVDVTLQSVTLTDNQVTKSGGAVDIGSSSTLSLSESVIRENDADGVSLGLGASIVCKTSNLDQNEGAGINRLFDDVDTIVLTDCSFGELDTSEVNSEGAILDNGMAVTLGNHETMTL